MILNIFIIFFQPVNGLASSNPARAMAVQQTTEVAKVSLKDIIRFIHPLIFFINTRTTLARKTMKNLTKMR